MTSALPRIPAALAPFALLALSATTACGTLATSSAWVGGGLEYVAPLREAEEEATAERERQIIARQPNEIGARHILVMHAQSKSKPPNVTRTRDEALKRAGEVLAKIAKGAVFEELVNEYSDEPGAPERHGDLGVFDRAQMVKPFADAAFALQVGQVSGIVETPFGFHVIKRTE
jgi:NIMA-interacting peptidyl-prolyl cis-trans isomerase 1